MDGFVRVLLALVAALNTAFAAPLVYGEMPDRPPIVAPTLQSLPADVITVTVPVRRTTKVVVGGTVAQMQDGTILVSGESIRLTQETTITGELVVGAVVNVQANRDGDSLQATQVEVREDAQPTGLAAPTDKRSPDQVEPTKSPASIAPESGPEKETQVGAVTPTVAPVPESKSPHQTEVKTDTGQKTTPRESADNGGTPSKDAGQASSKSSGSESGADKAVGSNNQSDHGGGSSKDGSSGD